MYLDNLAIMFAQPVSGLEGMGIYVACRAPLKQAALFHEWQNLFGWFMFSLLGPRSGQLRS